MNLITQARTRKIVDAICLIIIGLLMCVFTQASAEVFVMVSGIFCLVFGVLFIAAYFGTFLVHDAYLLLAGLFWILIGSLILGDPGTYLYVMVFAVSFYLLYEGVEEIAYSIDLEKLHVKNWWLDLIDGIISLGFGVAILCVTFTGGNSIALISILCGASLMYEGIMELLLIFLLHRDFKKNDKVVSIQ